MTADFSISDMRLLLRVSNAFVLDVFAHARGRLDFTDALILTVLMQSKGAAVAGDPALQRAYATFGAPPPASVRRPISINAIAGSLGMPFETVRRHVRRLVESGACEVLPEGVRLTEAQLRSSPHRRALERTYEHTCAFYERLKRAGCLPPAAAQRFDAAPLRTGAPPLRIVARAVSQYLLRMMEVLLPGFPSAASGFVLLAVFRANTRDIPDDLRGEDAFTPEAFLSDTLRRPARISEVADPLGLAYETVRRHIAALVEAGRIRRVEGGYIVPVETLMHPQVIAAFSGNLGNLNRMMTMLAETGVLSMWDAAAERTAAE